MRSIGLVVALAVLVGGCGSTIGAIEGLPEGPQVGDTPFPRLVDTPQPPEDRLMAGAGDRALERLTSSQTSIEARKARADAVSPVSDALTERLPMAQARRERAATVAPVSDDLLLRANSVRQRAAGSTSAEVAGQGTSAVSSTAGPARPVPLRPLDQPAVSSEFEERARRARERAASAGL